MRMATKICWQSGPDALNLYGNLHWEEPGGTGATVIFGLHVPRGPNESQAESDQRLMKEALRAARSFVELNQNWDDGSIR
jgi:hypothetical protein